MVAQFDGRADRAVRVDHHVPRQVRDLAGPQPCLGRQQHDDAVAEGVAGGRGVDEEVLQVVFRQCFRLLPRHESLRQLMIDSIH